MTTCHRLALAGMLLLGAGCSPVDRLLPNLDEPSPRLAGTSDAGFRKPDCPPVAFDVALDRSSVTGVLRIAGRAGPEPDVTLLWVDGWIDADETAQVEVRADWQEFQRARLYQLWRGRAADDGSIVLSEPEPSCGRKVVLAAR